MKLWLDADAAPREVKDICFRAAERRKLHTVLVANQRVQLPMGSEYVSAVRVDGGPDVADLYIAEHAAAGDVAVTADIPLAALLVPKGVMGSIRAAMNTRRRASASGYRSAISWTAFAAVGWRPAGTARTARARSRRSRTRSTARSRGRAALRRRSEQRPVHRACSDFEHDALPPLDDS